MSQTDSNASAPSLPSPERARADAARGALRRLTRRNNALRMSIIVLVVVWTFAYNLLIKEQTQTTLWGRVVSAFFRILDTISDDFVVGAILTIGLGLGILAVFSITKLYTQVVANVYSFRIIEDLFYGEFRRGEFREFFGKLLSLQDQPHPESCCPRRISSLMLSFSFLYIMSWVYIVLFSEAMFFLSWSAGVNLPINEHNIMQLPTLALAIPFCARVMAYMRYRYAQDYADFMPGAVFVLLMVATLGFLHESDDQRFFLMRVYENTDYLLIFLRNGTLLSFIPVLFEAGFWLYELTREENKARREEQQAAEEAGEGRVGQE